MTDLSDRLIEQGLVTREGLETARLEADKTGRSVWFTLIKLEYLSEESIVRFFGQEANIPYVRLSDYRIKQNVLDMLGEDFCRQNRVIPLWMVQDTLFIACNDPFNTVLLDTIGKLCRCFVEPLIATSTSIGQTIDHYWNPDNINFNIANFLVKQEPIKGMAFWRESERIAVDWPISVAMRDEAFALASSPSLEGRGHDISRDGSAIGIYLPLYLPKGIAVIIRIQPVSDNKPQDRIFETAGEIVHSYMHSGRDYSVGIRFSNIEEGAKKDLLRCALTQIKP
jgi:hypothetical protein